MSLAHTLYSWIDLLWLPLAYLTMEKGKRVLTCLYVIGCVFLLRLQIDLIRSTGFENGFFGVVKMGIFERGLITYGLFIGLFLLLAFFSKGSNKNIHFAASLTMLILAFCVSTLVMAL